MAENTPNLSLYLKDPIADGNDTFNIETMLNENFRKIDNSIGGKANSTDVTSEKVNVISAKAVSDLPAAYPDGLSVFTLSSTAAAAWRTETGHSANNAAVVETSKVTGGTTGEYLILQKVSFYSSTLGQEKITAVYQRSSGANNSWKSAWQKVVSPEEFTSHLADGVKHVTQDEKDNWNSKAAGNHNHSGVYEPVLLTEQKRKITYGTANPTGGVDGDIYLQYV